MSIPFNALDALADAFCLIHLIRSIH